jgi:VanZ family protein
MALIFGMSHRSTVPTPPGISASLTSVVGHLTVYFVLAILIWWALGNLIAPSPRRYATAWSLALLYALSDEWHQSFVPGRTPDSFDIATDAVGAALGLLLIHWLLGRPSNRLGQTDASNAGASTPGT